MGALEVADRYFAAWNHHDAAALAATFGDGGTYEDPATGGALRGPAIAGYAGGLFEAFPDVRFDVVSAAPCGDSAVAARWLMHGTK